jgi:hypothetical protein
VISNSYSNRKRDLAMPASSPVRTTWRALPVLTGDVRPDAIGEQLVGAVAFATAPGLLAWSPPV